MNLTSDILQKIAPSLKALRADMLAGMCNQLCLKYGINSADVFHEFIANVVHESGEFTIKKESLNYVHPERLVTVWPSRFTLDQTKEPLKLDAFKYIGDAVKLAEAVYGGRMGNIQKGDAYMFLGGGFAQITGRDAYTLYTRFVNNRNGSAYTIQEVAKLVQTDDMWAFDSAFWFFCEFKNLEQLAMGDKMLEIVKRWNGGLVGIKERQEIYARAKKAIPA